jgi:PEGA domain
MKKFISCVLIVSFFSAVTLAQTAAPSEPASKSLDSADKQTPKSTDSQPAATPAPKPAMQGFGLEDGIPVKLRTARTISSADAHQGDTLDFEVLEDISVSGSLVVPKGGIAWGTVTEAEPKRRMGRGGKLNVNIDAVRLADGEKVPLRAVKDVKGGGHQGAMTGAMVATGIVFFPAAPLFLFMHGKDITIPKGTEITAYINGDTHLDQAKFQNGSGAAQSATTVAGTAQMEISSTPAGADIELDGKFVGSTPSTITASPGEHEVIVKKSGFSPWSKTITLSAGHVTLNAELTSETKPTQ